jgi:glycosyltransferase involved in cell wall biosynthesis
MPVYNAAPYLRQAVSSILRQTFKEFEFIIIDDGSTDTVRMRSGFYSRYPRALDLPSDAGRTLRYCGQARDPPVSRFTQPRELENTAPSDTRSCRRALGKSASVNSEPLAGQFIEWR